MKEFVIHYNPFLYATSHLFIIPTLLSLYLKRFDVFWMIFSVLITSLLRWRYGNEIKTYQYIDHSWVKIVFLHMVFSSIYIILYYPTEIFKAYCLLGFLLNIMFFYIIELFVYESSCPILCVSYHMIVHFYTCFGFIFSLSIDYNYNQTWSLFLNSFIVSRKYITYNLFNMSKDQ